MRRSEAVAVLAFLLVVLVVGLAWQFGGWGLIGVAVGGSVLALVFVDVKEEGP